VDPPGGRIVGLISASWRTQVRVKKEERRKFFQKIYRGVEQLVARWAHIRQLADTGSSKKGRKKEVLSKNISRGGAVGSSLGSYPPVGGHRFE